MKLVLTNQVNLMDPEELKNLREFRLKKKKEYLGENEKILDEQGIQWMYAFNYSEKFFKDYSLMSLNEVTDIINKEI